MRNNHSHIVWLFIAILTVIMVVLCIWVLNGVQGSSDVRTEIIFSIIGIYVSIVVPLIEHHYEFLRNLINQYWIYGIAAFLLIASILSLILALNLLRLYPYGCSPAPCAVRESDGQLIGISGGLNHFWPDNGSNDVESRIYQEDNRVKEPGANYITFIVVTTLSDKQDMIAADQSEKGIGYDDLQGAYVLQMEDNGNGGCPLPNCLKIRLLVANVGFDAQYAMPVARQIVDLANQDHTIKGVMGWPSSTSDALMGIQYLGKHQILMISPSASSDKLTKQPFFTRVVPPDSQQGALGAEFVTDHFPAAQSVAVFSAPDNPYSTTLEEAFTRKFGKNKVIPETYNRMDLKYQRDLEISNDLQDAINKSARLIYFTGYSDDLNSLMNDLNSAAFKNMQIPVVAGDAAYDLSGYSGKGYQNLYFTAFAFPDQWGDTSKNPCAVPQYPLFCDYATDFDLHHQHPSPYGSSRVDSNVMLSYDALNMLVHASININTRKSIVDITTNDMWEELLQLKNFPGVSGSITLGPDGNPINKPMVILHVNPEGKASMLHMCQQSEGTWSCPSTA